MTTQESWRPGNEDKPSEAPERDPHVQVALSRLMVQVSALDGVVAKLSEKLTPVLLRYPDDAAREEDLKRAEAELSAPDELLSVPLAAQVNEAAERLRHVSWSVIRLVDRLEV